MNSKEGSRFILPLLILLNLSLLTAFHTIMKQNPDEEEIRKITDYVQESKEWDGRLAPDFELNLNNGQAFRIADEVGKSVILLNFFATWCAPCRAEMPELNRYYLKHKGRPLIMIGIDANETKELVDKFVNELKVTFPIGIDQKNIQFLYEVKAYPTTVVIGVDGRVQYYQSGAISNADIAFDSLLNAGEEMLKADEATSKKEYLAGLEIESDHRARGKGPQLTGRAKDIADKMPCVCGCSDMVITCGCSTAQKIVKKLRTEDLEGRTDEEVILALNKEFCVGAKNE